MSANLTTVASGVRRSVVAVRRGGVNYEIAGLRRDGRPLTGAAGAAASVPADVVATMTRILNLCNRYTYNTWYPATYGTSGTVTIAAPTGTQTGENSYRQPATAAAGLATALYLGIHDPAVAGASVEEARAMSKRITLALAGAHLGNKTGGWGAAGPPVEPYSSKEQRWQCALWAGAVGQSAWMQWDYYTEAEKTLVRNMVIQDAGRFASYVVPYWRDRSGKELSAGDSKGEENAWNTSTLLLAGLMAPTDSRAQAWMAKACELAISVYARPSDLTSSALTHGRVLSKVLNGTNMSEGGLVTNHDAISPDYATAPKSQWISIALLAGAGRKVPASLLYNVDLAYAATVDTVFASPPHTAPGGTIYVRGSGEIYYPQGADWGLRYLDKASWDVHALAYGWDRGASVKADVWARLHAAKAVDMQARYTTGQMYGPAAEDTYSGREQTVVYNAGTALLAARAAAGSMTISNEEPAALLEAP